MKLITKKTNSDTNIDWTAYTQQTTLYLQGERNYLKIAGDTGPLVYPATHVYIYTLLYNLTSSGTNIFHAQILFGGLYVLVLTLVLLALRAANAPPWVMMLCSLSKRAHSIFVLRLFNDCWAVLGLWGAVVAWQGGWWAVGSVIFALGLGVKMVLLLALPAVGAMLWQAVGRNAAVGLAGLMGVVQVSFCQIFLGVGISGFFLILYF
jgi:alpha-1,3-mannosyltransferase